MAYTIDSEYPISVKMEDGSERIVTLRGHFSLSLYEIMIVTLSHILKWVPANASVLIGSTQAVQSVIVVAIDVPFRRARIKVAFTSEEVEVRIVDNKLIYGGFLKYSDPKFLEEFSIIRDALE